MSKKCTKCLEILPLTAYHKDRTKPDGRRPICRPCRKQNRIDAGERFKVYSLTVEQYTSILHKQQNRCAICYKHNDEVKRGLVVDHCHSTGKVRGLLCNDCNTSIGKLGDSIEGIERALKYLKESE